MLYDKIGLSFPEWDGLRWVGSRVQNKRCNAVGAGVLPYRGPLSSVLDFGGPEGICGQISKDNAVTDVTNVAITHQ